MIHIVTMYELINYLTFRNLMAQYTIYYHLIILNRRLQLISGTVVGDGCRHGI